MGAAFASAGPAATLNDQPPPRHNKEADTITRNQQAKGNRAMDEKHVVVTTEWRGVFFGLMTAYDKDARRCTLTDARCALYWSAETGGFLGLAQTGPLGESRVSQTAPEIELHGVTAITDCTEKAAETWRNF